MKMQRKFGEKQKVCGAINCNGVYNFHFCLNWNEMLQWMSFGVNYMCGESRYPHIAFVSSIKTARFPYHTTGGGMQSSLTQWNFCRFFFFFFSFCSFVLCRRSSRSELSITQIVLCGKSTYKICELAVNRSHDEYVNKQDLSSPDRFRRCSTDSDIVFYLPFAIIKTQLPEQISG